MEIDKLLFKMLRNGIEDMRNEKYHLERNSIGGALQSTLNELEEIVKNTVDLGGVSGEGCPKCGGTIMRLSKEEFCETFGCKWERQI